MEMNPETEREIWRRVQQTDRLNAEEILLPERLETLLQELQRSADFLIRTAQRLHGTDRTRLLRTASALRADAKELAALHYLLTGRRLRLRREPLPPQKPIPEELRDLYFHMKKLGKEFSALQREFAEYAEWFGQRERSAGRAAQEITGVLKGRLDANESESGRRSRSPG